MKIGDKVAVLWDCKLCRGTLGVVTGTRKNGRIQVEFASWSNSDEIHKIWFPKRKRRVRYGEPRYEYSRHIVASDGYVCELSEWYTLIKFDKFTKMGYKVS